MTSDGSQVRRELDPAEVEAERGGEGPREERLAEPRQVLDQDVTAGQHAQHHQFQGVRFADDGTADLTQYGTGLLAYLLGGTGAEAWWDSSRRFFLVSAGSAAAWWTRSGG